jgi:hypothetical protein
MLRQYPVLTERPSPALVVELIEILPLTGRGWLITTQNQVSKVELDADYCYVIQGHFTR